MPKCNFNKAAKQLYGNRTSHGCSPLNLLHIFRTPFLKNTFGLWTVASVDHGVIAVYTLSAYLHLEVSINNVFSVFPQG